MPAFSFQKQFVPFVLDGSKQHTIRGNRKHAPRAGQTFYGYNAMRTKQCSKLIEAPLVKVEEIVFERARVWIGGEELHADEKDKFAWRDGFRHELLGRCQPMCNPTTNWHEISCDTRQGLGFRGCFDLMLQFWVETRKTTEFEGHLIHWDWARRVRS